MYIDYDYYISVYKGTDIDEDTFYPLAQRACDIIDILTGGKISMSGFDNLSPFQKEQVKRACTAQTEYLHGNGGLEFIADAGNLASIRIGSFEMGSKNRTQGDDATGGSLVSPLVSGYLMLTGLLYTGVVVC